MNEFLKEILNDKDYQQLKEILNFSLDKDNIEFKELQQRIAEANYFRSKLIKIILKLELLYSDLETELEQWKAEKIHEIPYEYDGQEQLLKNIKDYERELYRNKDFIKNQKDLKKLKSILNSLKLKENSLQSFDWVIKNIIDIEKIKNGIY